MNRTSRPSLLVNGSKCLLAFLLVSGSAQAAVEVDQQPLLVAKPVPGNMAIIGSFEFPTMVTRAYKTSYSTSGDYVGYFDGAKCYKYSYNDDETRRHFYPVRSGTNCTSADEWSGRFLNWSTMQSIDIFRHILTGGYRHVDTATETWLEKGVQTGQGAAGNNFPDANISDDNVIKGVTPTTWSDFKTRIGIANRRMGNKMRFTREGDLSAADADVLAYNPASHGYGNNKNFNGNKVFEVSVRVKVCVQGMLEANCQEYDQAQKPEGLIQANSDNMRYSAFGYINDNSNGSNNRNREGGIMHARMKYVGPKKVTDENVVQNNDHREWDPETGVFVANPDPADASGTAVGTAGAVIHSGVISYINNSGMIVPDTLFKRYDNVSELYYTAYRYIKKLGNVSAYTARPAGMSDANWRKLVGGLPIITDWYEDGNDPLQFACQKTFFLGIGDTNTHVDTAIPKSDDSVPIADRRSKISSLEGGGVNVTGAGTGSDYIAALAYDAHTADIRLDMDGKQTVSTYWIDILESGLKARKNNPYWLAAKYGGFRVPEEYDPDANTTALAEALWHTNGQTLSTGDKRPDNFYVVASAADMVTSLTQAFTDIQAEQRGNRSSLALNSTVLETGAATFQAEYTSGTWTGNLNAYRIDATSGAVGLIPAWDAASKLPPFDSRNIWTNNGSAMVQFKTGNGGISTQMQTDLTTASGTGNATHVVNFIRGERANENSLNGFRVRQGVLGDIVNSQPVYVGAPSQTLFRNRTFNGSSTYTSWAADRAGRTPVVYVGGNDGMLHGFNATVGGADSGKEVFAFIPRTVLSNGLGELARRDYEHRYFVDGELTVADAYDGTSWRTILVGTLGAGGINKDRDATRNSIFALDITNPGSVSLLWEKNSSDIPALGINSGKPVIAQVANGKWMVLLGNGPNSSADTASLISINLFNSTNVVTTSVSSEANNGLSAIRAWDSDGDGFTDTAYAGDLQGKLWKIGNLGGTRTVTSLFTAVDPVNGDRQPIAAMPLVGRSPYSQELFLFFGTGQYINTADLSTRQVQSWYGIKDIDTAATRSDLLERKILADVPVSGGLTARVIEDGAREDLNQKNGWYIDLYQVSVGGNRSALGERMVTPNQFQGSALVGNTRIPDASDPCAPTGRGVIMAIDPFTGARLVDTYFDLNDDSDFTNTDMVQINGVLTVVSGIGLDTGFSNPSFLDQKMYIPDDEGKVRDFDISPFSVGAGRTSWRELINLGN